MDFFSIPDRFNLKKQKKRIYYTPITPETGEMAEWPKAAVSKTVNGFTRSGVRIPLSPPSWRNEAEGFTSLCEAQLHIFTRRSRSSLSTRSALLVKSLPWVACEEVSLRCP